MCTAEMRLSYKQRLRVLLSDCKRLVYKAGAGLAVI